MDKLMVWGAWGLMAAVGSLSGWKISQTPKVDPIIAILEKDLHPEGPVMAPPPPVPVWNNPWDKTLLLARPVGWGAGDVYVKPLPPPPPPPHPPIDVWVLPFAVIGESKAGLDGTTLTWSIQEPPKEDLQSWMTQKTAKPTGFIIRRACGDEKPKDVATVAPELRSFTDLSAQPRQSYRYWVLVTGKETKRTSYPAEQEEVAKGNLVEPVKLRTPSATRVKLVGGDRTTAVLRIDTYDRTQKKWILAKMVTAAPGRDVGSSGWTLKGLRFDNFTLVADVTDDEGVDHALNTKD